MERLLPMGMKSPSRKRAQQERPQAFRSVDDLLQAADRMFRARGSVSPRRGSFAPANSLKCGPEAALTCRRLFHESLELSAPDLPFWSECLNHGLTVVEREVILTLALSHLGILKEDIRKCGDVLEFLNLSALEKIEALRALRPLGRLARIGLVSYDDLDEEVRSLVLILDPDLLEALLSGQSEVSQGWPVTTEDELYRYLHSLSVAFWKRADVMEDYYVFRVASQSSLARHTRRVTRLLNELDSTLSLHPNWRICKLLEQAGGSGTDRRILLILTGKQLGHYPPSDRLYSASFLAKAVTHEIEDMKDSFGRLDSEGSLIKLGLVQPCEGSEPLLTDDPDELANVYYELTDKSLEILGLEHSRRRTRNRIESVRPPKVRLDQLVFSPTVREAVEMALSHARHCKQLMEDWGLSETITYGRAVTLLFSGPPGVGKTACAEAIAHELGSNILAVDYSEVQNCFVGGTEKRIVSTFRQAARHNAVLFWDEADAMLFRRDNAQQTWETRQVNVLLQELERFEGVCILATNRECHLDLALERRITLKVRFERPDRDMRLRIWKRMIPSRLPLAADIDMDEIIEADLSGGEIKNAILNAARLALSRGDGGPVDAEAIRRAIEMERAGRFDQSRPRIGFKQPG